jgi:integrase
MKFREWLPLWLSSKEGYIKEATFANYTLAVINHIIPTLGDFKLIELTEVRIQETVLGWLRDGRLDKMGGLSEKTVRDLLMIVKLSLKAAQKKFGATIEQIEIRFPKTERISKLKVLMQENQEILVNAAMEELTFRNAGILLALATGIRIGELCALTWKDIDLKCKTISITKTMQRIFIKNLEGEGFSHISISSPKTFSSVREIPLSSFIMPVLTNVSQGEGDRYLLTGTESYLEPRSFSRYFDRFQKKLELPHINFHGLRHTFATRLVEAGADIKTISELLGHAHVDITLNLYVHPQMEQKRKCVELITLPSGYVET